MAVERRQVLAAMVGVASVAVIARPACAQTATGAFQFRFEGLDGSPLPLAPLAGRVLLVVNTASRCGFNGNMPGFRSCGRGID